ncbi:MAG: hypothetical protein ACTSWD_00050 [Candidatus Heimdallarchaeota archaeon]
MIKDDKDKIIDEIRNLRTMIGEIETVENSDQAMNAQRQLNKIHNMVFGI